MEVLKICPVCGSPGIPVPHTAVKYNLNLLKQSEINLNIRWFICGNPGCDCSYFSKNQTFKTTDLIKPLWYKDKGDKVPICYCSDLSRGEVRSAVKQGCKTISSVQKFTKKNITGLCEERNPLGKCCRDVFLKTIADSI